MDQQFHYEKNYYEGVYGYLYNPDYYQKVARFWKYNLFDSNGYSLNEPILDYGSGLGQITAAMQAHCYDPSTYANDFMQRKGITTIAYSAIQSASYQYLLSSHSLEHSLTPIEDLRRFHHILKPAGLLFLLLPIEPVPGKPTKQQDIHRHFSVWNFQAITNLLIEAGFEIEAQKKVNGPWGLNNISSMVIVQTLGRWKNNFPSILTIAKRKA
jgi:SAM-dependent methyltransferase